jgi:fermentation-respiration switch protein FrsA (DUF1100 family)
MNRHIHNQRRAASVVAAVAVCASGCFDLDSFVMNPRHCSVGYSDDECDLKNLCTACGDDFDFEAQGIPQELATRHPIALDDGEENDAWFVAADPTRTSPLSDVTIVFSHGNFGGIEHYLNRVALLWQTGANVFAVEYRGFGHSSDDAEPSEAQFMADTAAAWNQVPEILADHGLDPLRPVAVAGYSAGALSSTEMVSIAAPDDGGGACALLHEAPWPSVETFARDSTFIGVPGSFVSAGGWNNIDKMADYDGPYLHLHGSLDLTVRETLGRELFDATGSTTKRFVSVEGAAHGNFIAGVDEDGVEPDVAATLGDEYLDLVEGFLGQHCR